MKIWIHVNGVQQGPYTKEQIAAMHLPPATPVWYEGLAQWVPACQASELADIFGNDAPDSPQPCDTRQDTGEPISNTYAQAAATAYSTASQPPRPATFLGWSIVLTLCCCTPFSIAAIVCGAIANSRYNSGDYDGARRMSRATEWLVILAITLGIVGLPLGMFWYM